MIFEMLHAYKITSLLRAAIELGVFDHLASCGCATADELAESLELDKRGSLLLLNALAAIHLVEMDGGRYHNAEASKRYLVTGGDGYLGAMAKIIASRWEWDALWNLPAAVRGGGTVMDENAETPGYEYWVDFANHAAAIAGPAAHRVAVSLGAWATGRDQLDILDVACGHGIYGAALAAAHPQARLWALDWPNVLEVAAGHAERLGVLARRQEIPGDMFEAPLGGPYDVVLITNVLHHFSSERSVEFLRRAVDVLAPGGRVVIVGFTVSDTPPAEEPEAHLFSILMLVWTHSGQVHTQSAYEKMVADVGLRVESTHSVPGLPFKIITARRAGDT